MSVVDLATQGAMTFYGHCINFVSVKNLREIKEKVTLSFMVISNVYKSIVSNKTTFTKYCLTQWISRLPGALKSTELGSTWQISVGLADIVNAAVYKTGPVLSGLGHGKLS